MFVLPALVARMPLAVMLTGGTYGAVLFLHDASFVTHGEDVADE